MAVLGFEQARTQETSLTNESLYQGMARGELLNGIDLASLLQASAKDDIVLSPERITDYSLLPLRTPKGSPSTYGCYADGFGQHTSGEDIANQYRDGRFYRIYLNSPVGLALCYRDSPQALTSFSAETRLGDLLISQIQGIRSYSMPIPSLPEHIRGSRGLAPLRHPELMVRLTEELARGAGFGAIAIRPAWYISESEINEKIDFDGAKKIYDNTAISLGYKLDTDSNWRKSLS